MTDLSPDAADHIERLRALQAGLPAGVAVLEHHYRLLLMGSFVMEVGTEHDRLRFSWDGREFFLNVERSRLPSRSSVPAWGPAGNERIAPPASVWDAIHRWCQREFCP